MILHTCSGDRPYALALSSGIYPKMASAIILARIGDVKGAKRMAAELEKTAADKITGVTRDGGRLGEPALGLFSLGKQIFCTTAGSERAASISSSFPN